MSKERELLNRMAEQLRTVLFLSDDAKQLIAEYDAVTAPDQPKDAEPVAWTDEWLRDKMENAVCPACGNTGLHACTGPSAPSADRRDAELCRAIAPVMPAILEMLPLLKGVALFGEFGGADFDGAPMRDALAEAIGTLTELDMICEEQAIARDAQNARKGEEG